MKKFEVTSVAGSLESSSYSLIALDELAETALMKVITSSIGHRERI